MSKPVKQLELVPVQVPEKPGTDTAAEVSPPTTDAPPTETRALAVLDFDWSDASHLVVAEQRAVAIYLNPAGDVVIRQQTWPDDDPFVVVSPDNIMAVIDRLCDIAGIPSAGGPRSEVE